MYHFSGKTYLYKEDRFWRYNETSNSMDDGYPLGIRERWRGVPENLDAASTWNDGKHLRSINLSIFNYLVFQNFSLVSWNPKMATSLPQSGSIS